MKRRSTPHQQRKRNRKGRPAPRYFVEIDASYWRLKYPNWRELSDMERVERMQASLKEVHAFLNTRRPKGQVQLWVMPAGYVTFGSSTEEAPIRVRELPDKPRMLEVYG